MLALAAMYVLTFIVMSSVFTMVIRSQVDYQAVHWYDIGFDKFKKYITDYHNQLGLPILITEFADQVGIIYASTWFAANS